MSANDLSSLISHMKRVCAADTNIEHIIDQFNEQLGTGIKIHYKVIKAVENKTAETTRNPLFWLRTAATAIMVLSADRVNADHGRKLIRQCNGVVIEYPSWKVYTRPTESMPLHHKRTAIVKNFAKYTIHPITDGSIVNLYYYGGSWCIGSAHGYDVSDFQLFGDNTFRGAITELLGNFDRLDKTHSYTIGFRHHDFHPMIADPKNIWLIHECVIGNDIPEIVTPTIRIPQQAAITGKTYDAIMAETTTSISAFQKTGAINYGYILRGDCGANSNIIIETDLMMMVRNMIYNLPKGKTQIPLKTPRERVEYMSVNAFCSYRHRDYYISMFPQFKKYFDSYSALIGQLQPRVSQYIRNSTATPAQGSQDLIQLAAKLGNELKSLGVNACNQDAQSIISDYLIQPDRIPDYYLHFIAQKR